MQIDQIFPQLAASGFRLASQETVDYNCIAWAAGSDDRWWEPTVGYYWPSGIPQDGTLDSLIQLYQGLGYVVCDDGDLEPGYEKVALYGIGTDYEHAARQLEDGKWTSKIGALEDIEHDSPDGIAGSAYGAIQCYMKRPRK